MGKHNEDEVEALLERETAEAEAEDEGRADARYKASFRKKLQSLNFGTVPGGYKDGSS